MSPARGEAASWTRRWTPVGAWAGVILILTSWPNPTAGEDVGFADKIAHFSVYSVLGWLSARAMLTPRSIGALAWTGIALACFGALDELHQIWIPNRFATIADWMADVLGISVGLLSYHLTRSPLVPRPGHST